MDRAEPKPIAPVAPEGRPRIRNLDFLRGVFIILALQQHFAYYLNVWYTDFTKIQNINASRYAVHFSFYQAGQPLPLDGVTHWMAWAFTPWVSQIYLSLAAFNLASRSQTEFRPLLAGRLKLFGAIFLFFTVENILVAPSMGEAFSIYPLQTWMLVLALLAVAYAYTGVRGVLILFAANALLRFTLPTEEWARGFEVWMQARTMPSFEYDARVELFVGSGVIGFCLGRLYYSNSALPRQRMLWGAGGLGLVLLLAWVVFGPRFHIDPNNILKTEHLLSLTILGSVGIWGSILLTMAAFLWLEDRGFSLRVPVVTWIGVNSLLVFGLHRIFFVHLIGPLREFFGAVWRVPMQNHTGEIYGAIALATLLSWLTARLGILRMLAEKFPEREGRA